MDGRRRFVTDSFGDVTGIQADRTFVEVDPDKRGWTAATDRAEGHRSSIEDVLNIDGPTVESIKWRRLHPAPHPTRVGSRWQWPHGEAPPAAMTYRTDGALWFYDRLLAAIGWARYRLASVDADQIPIHVYDLARGRRISFGYTPPELGPEPGRGAVYLVENTGCDHVLRDNAGGTRPAHRSLHQSGCTVATRG